VADWEFLSGRALFRSSKSLLPSSTPVLAQASVDWPVAAAVGGLALITGRAFGLAPALSASQIDLAQSIRTGASVPPRQPGRGCEAASSGVALIVVLVVSAGLLIKSLYTLSEVRPGFQSRQSLTVRISPNPSFCTQGPACIALYQRLPQGTPGVSGVAAAAIGDAVPLDAAPPNLAVDVEDHPQTVDHPSPVLWSGAVSPGYIGMMCFRRLPAGTSPKRTEPSPPLSF